MVMINYVSVSAYNDAELLKGCLKSIRDELGDVDIRVVDGKYESWPSGADNSIDHTKDVCHQFNATHDPAGPFHRERDKHIYRVEKSPDGERVLFLDADERLHDVNHSELNNEDRVAYQPRIANSLIYGPKSVYWPRSFFSETVKSINRWDAYLFEAPCKRTDNITIIHRHGLRDDEYRDKKNERFSAEDREGREIDRCAEFSSCPLCGMESLTMTQATDYDREMTYVEMCTNSECLHAAIKDLELGEYQYVPDRIDEGFTEDPVRLRRELLDALPEHRAGVFRQHGLDVFMEMRDLIARWAKDEL